MAASNPRTETAEVVRTACDGSHETNADLTEAIVGSLRAKQLIYPGREGRVRSVVAGAINGQPWNARREAVSDRIWSELIGSGEIVGSWLC